MRAWFITFLPLTLLTQFLSTTKNIAVYKKVGSEFLNSNPLVCYNFLFSTKLDLSAIVFELCHLMCQYSILHRTTGKFISSLPFEITKPLLGGKEVMGHPVGIDKENGLIKTLTFIA